VPIWKIDLNAPQYPEGIGLRIWLNKITGVHEFDLDNINKLNHYIGMKTIEPDSIPELKIMPYIIAFFVIFGLTVFLLKRKRLIYVWCFLMIVILTIGLYDYYVWEYDYGHNLNPNAPIKVPGMTYQPPLLGTKQLLNMRTTSLPDIGSYLIGISLIGMVGVLIYEKKKKN
jgi:copper chaperone NosL